MECQQPSTSSLQRVKADQDDIRETRWPLVAGSGDRSSPSPFTGSPQQPFDSLDPHSLTSFETNNVAGRTTNTKPQTQHPTPESSSLPYPSFSMSVFPPEQHPRDSRYYTQELSVEDKSALAQGEKNHNLQEWSGKHLVTHYEARKDLVPKAMPKVEKTHALASIEHDKQHSRRAFDKLTEKVRKFFGLSYNKATIDDNDDESADTQSRKASQSTYDHRSSTLSPPEPCLLRGSNSIPSFEEFVDNTPRHHASHARSASSGDYFWQPPDPRASTYNAGRTSSLATTSGPSPTSDTSNRVYSPLTQQVQFRANPEITFESMLAPHKAGKGEVLKDSKYAQKVKTRKASPSPSPSPNSKAKTRRLTRIPSIPLLRRSGSGSGSG